MVGALRRSSVVVLGARRFSWSWALVAVVGWRCWALTAVHRWWWWALVAVRSPFFVGAGAVVVWCCHRHVVAWWSRCRVVVSLARHCAVVPWWLHGGRVMSLCRVQVVSSSSVVSQLCRYRDVFFVFGRSCRPGCRVSDVVVSVVWSFVVVVVAWCRRWGMVLSL